MQYVSTTTSSNPVNFGMKPMQKLVYKEAKLIPTSLIAILFTAHKQL